MIDFMPGQSDDIDKGGTLRLGAYPCHIKSGTAMECCYLCWHHSSNSPEFAHFFHNMTFIGSANLARCSTANISFKALPLPFFFIYRCLHSWKALWRMDRSHRSLPTTYWASRNPQSSQPVPDNTSQKSPGKAKTP